MKNNKLKSVVLILLMLLCVAAIGVAAYYGRLYIKDAESFESYRGRSDEVVDSLNSKLESSGSEIARLEDEISRLKEEQAALQSNISRLTDESAKKSETIQSLEEQLGALSERNRELARQIKEKEARIEELCAQLRLAQDNLEKLKELYEEVSVYDINAQYEIVNELNTLLRETPYYEIEEVPEIPETDEYGEPLLDEEGNPQKVIKKVYYRISLYYEDLTNGHHFSFDADASWHTASLVKLPFALAVFEAASDYAEENPEEYEKMLAAALRYEESKPETPPPLRTKKDENGETIVLAPPLYKGTDYPYDFYKEFAYLERESYQSGSGKIIERGEGTVYTHKQLFEYLLRFSDNVAYYQLKEAYGTDMHRALVRRLECGPMSLSLASISARDGGKVLRAVYDFIQAGRTYSEFMYDCMITSGQSVMIADVVAPTPCAHKYGWDKGNYHDAAIIYDEHPYLLVILTDMDTGSAEINAYIQSIVRQVVKLHESFHIKTGS
ncbi:MAG: hypothetical protein GX897_03120 [Clostridiales bacterium]|nr:hypothetical protein [Clostridiales bacterium]